MAEAFDAHEAFADVRVSISAAVVIMFAVV